MALRLRRFLSICSVLVAPSWHRTTANTFVDAFFVQHKGIARGRSPLLANSDNNDFPDSANINGGSNSQREQRQKKPSTGWNHNQPSESSKFWKTVGGEDDATSSPNEPPKRQLRTGWLHNTEKKSTPAVRGGSTTAAAASTTKNANPNLARRRLDMAKRQQERNHRMISPPAFHAGGGDTVVAVTEHMLSVPLRYGTNDRSMIDVYYSIVEPIRDDKHRVFLESLTDRSPRQRAEAYVQTYHQAKDLDDTVLYLQGGPGFGAPTPVTGLGVAKGSGSWADAALYQCNYRRIVLMDQRGTGRSTPITKQTLEMQFPALFTGDTTGDQPDTSALQEATDYMAQFRADNIVRDAERIREALLYEDVEADDEDERLRVAPWGCSLGQSYGGFCSMTYMSQVDRPPKIMLLTGGIGPMMDKDAVDVYGRLWDRVRTRNQLYYAMYPGDVARVRRIVRKLMRDSVRLPSGGQLTPRRFLLLGIALGSSPSSFASMHELISTVFANADVESDEDLVFTRAFLKKMDSIASFDDHPIYYWMHESIYADGTEKSPTQWAAERALASKIEAEPAAFDYRKTSMDAEDSNPVLFYGEHVFSWMSEDFAELSGSGVTALAQALADKKDWGPLYNADHMREVLQDSRTRAAAAVYFQDMYVDFDACTKVTAPGGPLERCKLYVTNEYQHSGLRDNGAALFAKLHGMATGGTRVPS